MGRKSELKRYRNVELTDIKSHLCDNLELSNAFIDDFLRVIGLEVDEEGYIIDSEADPFDPEYILIRGKALRLTNQGIVHAKDLIFDPYNNNLICEELFKSYIIENHPEISSFQIFSAKKDVVPKMNTLGYLMVLYNNGAQIKTWLHYKDSTKFLEMFMRLESMSDELVKEVISKYDDYERTVYDEKLAVK